MLKNDSLQIKSQNYQEDQQTDGKLRWIQKQFAKEKNAQEKSMKSTNKIIKS